MTTIKKNSELDEIQKAIYRLQDTATHAFKAAPTLDEKVEMEQLRRRLTEIDKLFKLQRHRLEDAIKYAKGATHCETCYSIVAKTRLP